MNNRPMRGRDWALDVAVALIAFLFGCVQLMLAASSIIIPDLALRQYLGLVSVVPGTSAFVAVALTTWPLALRRRFPWPVFLFVLITFLGLRNAFGDLSLSVVGPVVALCAIASERSRVEAAAAASIAVGGLILYPLPVRTANLAFFTQVQNAALLISAALAGYAYRTHRAYVRAVEQRALEAERSREEEAARRVEEERVRIAREVHDITAHSLSAVSVQTAAAERLIDRDPAAAKEAIASARSTAKSALEDIRSMIGVLRHGDDPAETAPAAGTERLADIAAFLEQAGVTAALDVSGYDRARVPAHVDMALCGIAREAATNIVRHAQAGSAILRLSLADGAAHLRIEDDGKGSGRSLRFGEGQPLRAADGLGHGIVGMAERVRLLGGAFEAGDLPSGGFRVAVSVPVAGTVDAGTARAGGAAKAERGVAR